MKRLACILVLFILAAQSPAQDFHVVASRRTVIRETASSSARDLARIDAGETLNCITDPATSQPEQRERFYRVRLVDGREGWASAFNVRIERGVAPGTATGITAAAGGPLAHHAGLVGLPRGYFELANDGYIVGYDPRLKIPAWVQYRLTREDIATDRPRSNAFGPDDRVPTPGQSTPADYAAATSWNTWNALGLQPPQTGATAYVRGHLAPARDMARTDDIERSSYLLTNMAPMVHNGFNNGLWGSLENRVRQWVNDRGELTIIIGPVFMSSPRQIDPPVSEAERAAAAVQAVVMAQPPVARQVVYNVVGEGEVAVPTAMFKVIIDLRDPREPEVIAFLVPHFRRIGANLAEYLVSVRDIERMTGLDLLSELEDEIEQSVEAVRAPALW